MSSRPRSQCVVCSHHAKWWPHSVCLQRQDHQDVGGGHWVSRGGFYHFSVAQALTETWIDVIFPFSSIFQFLYCHSSSLWSEPYPIYIYFVLTSAETCTLNLHISRLQVLCEDIHRPQGVGEDGASQPGRLVDCQLLQRPDGACLGGRLEGVQSGVAGAWTCGRVHLLGPWQRSPHHPGGHRLRGVYSCCRMWHLPTEDVCVC